MSEQPSPLTPSTQEPSTQLSRWGTTKPLQTRVRALLSQVVALVLGAVLFIVPMPYVVESPGPTFGVDDSYRGKEMLSISDVDPSNSGAFHVDAAHEKGDGNGKLRMATVSEQGGPDRRLNLVQLINASLSETSQLTPYPTAYPDGVTMDQVDAAQLRMVESSQSSADVTALEALGWTVPTTTTIRGAAEGSSAAEKVRDGNVLLSIIDEAGVVHLADSAPMVFRLMKQTPAGPVLVLCIMRDGKQIEPEVETIPDESHSQGSHLGIYLDVAPRFPLDVQVNLKSVDGPSAGLVFSLAIVDKLAPGGLTGGHVITTTGTMSYDDEVGSIDRIVQRMHGAERDGGEWFLTPTLNHDEVVGNAPESLSVVAVTTLGEAREAVEAVAAGQAGKLTSCESVAGAS